MSGWSLVQAPAGTYANATGTATVNTFAAAPTPGNLMVYLFNWAASPVSPVLSGWTPAATSTANGKFVAAMRQVVSGDSATITIPAVAGSSRNNLSIAEFAYSGGPLSPSVDSPAVFGSDAGNVSTLTAGPTGTLAQNDLLLGFLAVTTSISAVSPSSPFALAGTPAQRTAIAWANAADLSPKSLSASWTGAGSASLGLVAINPAQSGFIGWGIPL